MDDEAEAPLGDELEEAVPEGDAERWYPLAVRLLRQLMVSEDPPEFVTELLMPFTVDCVRNAEDPWARARALCPGKFTEQ